MCQCVCVLKYLANDFIHTNVENFFLYILQYMVYSLLILRCICKAKMNIIMYIYVYIFIYICMCVCTCIND